MKGIELRERMDLIFQDVKELLLKGNFDLGGNAYLFIPNTTSITVSGIHLPVRLDHARKEAAPESDFLMWHDFIVDERKAIYFHIITGGISIAIKNTENEIDRLKKELVNMKLLKDNQ